MSAGQGAPAHFASDTTWRGQGLFWAQQRKAGAQWQEEQAVRAHHLGRREERSRLAAVRVGLA